MTYTQYHNILSEKAKISVRDALLKFKGGEDLLKVLDRHSGQGAFFGPFIWYHAYQYLHGPVELHSKSSVNRLYLSGSSKFIEEITSKHRMGRQMSGYDGTIELKPIGSLAGEDALVILWSEDIVNSNMFLLEMECTLDARNVFSPILIEKTALHMNREYNYKLEGLDDEELDSRIDQVTERCLEEINVLPSMNLEPHAILHFFAPLLNAKLEAMRPIEQGGFRLPYIRSEVFSKLRSYSGLIRDILGQFSKQQHVAIKVSCLEANGETIPDWEHSEWAWVRQDDFEHFVGVQVVAVNPSKSEGSRESILIGTDYPLRWLDDPSFPFPAGWEETVAPAAVLPQVKRRIQDCRCLDISTLTRSQIRGYLRRKESHLVILLNSNKTPAAEVAPSSSDSMDDINAEGDGIIDDVAGMMDTSESSMPSHPTTPAASETAEWSLETKASDVQVLQASCTTRENVHRAMNDPSSIFYMCTSSQQSIRGLPVDRRYLIVKLPVGEIVLYVPRSDLERVLADPRIRLYSVSKSTWTMEFTASASAADDSQWVSSNHCQVGTSKQIYRVRGIR